MDGAEDSDGEDDMLTLRDNWACLQHQDGSVHTKKSTAPVAKGQCQVTVGDLIKYPVVHKERLIISVWPKSA